MSIPFYYEIYVSSLTFIIGQVRWKRLVGTQSTMVLNTAVEQLFEPTFKQMLAATSKPRN